MTQAAGVRVVIGGAAATMLGALAFMIVYARGGGIIADGTCAVVMLAGIALSFGTWALVLLEPKRVVEERDVAPSAQPLERALGRDVAEASLGLSRPKLFAALSAAAAGTIGLAAIFPLRSLAYPPANARTEPQSPWHEGVLLVDEDGHAMHAESLSIGGIATAFPQGAIDDPTASVVVIRLDPRASVLPGRAAWSPQGYIAFSKICTHVGCPVALYRHSDHELLCPCHQSRFDVLAGAKPVGGPASRPLPQLALRIDPDGSLRAANGFVEPVGPAAWTTL